jgi:hypothetical protein
MHRFISPTGEIIKTRSIKEFAEKYDFSPSMARSLACGYRSRLKGFCSTSPRAKKERMRFMTVLINTQTGERSILGPSVKKFATDHGLCFNELSKLVNGHKLMYRGWVLEKTLNLANGHVADRNI